jgi:Ca-activated chloride channel family protein
MLRSSSRAFIYLCTLCLFGTLPALGAPVLQAQQQPAASASQQPVQDLTPPSDAEVEQAAKQAEAQKNASAANQPANTGTTGKPADKRNDQYVFRAEVEEVMLYATVVDPKNRLVTDLDKTAFAVYEDGQPQQITSFRREDIPVSIGIVIDNSGSMRMKRPSVNQAALNFVRASNKQDEDFIVNFNDADSIFIDQDFTSDINAMKESLVNIEARGATALYDAVIASADHLVKGGKRDKKVLMVITDGQDDASTKNLEDAVKAVTAENGPTIYTIGILDDASNKDRKRARRALERLAIETGGVAYFPKDYTEVDEITRAVAHDIRNQYTIGYKPSRPQSEGGYRQVRVEAKEGKDRLQVRTKSGYYAGQKQAAAGQPGEQ